MKSQPRQSGWLLLRRILSLLFWPFVLLYAMGVRLKNAAYDHRLLKASLLSSPVVSIGNLSVGGTGKTPIALLLTRLLAERGWSPDILSRGYGRSSRRVERVPFEGSPEEFGDEPLLMAQRGIAVYVGANRYQAGILAEKDAGNHAHAAPNISGLLHILDDGFQHRRLARTVDIVLLQRADLTDEMLPLGRLREPLSALTRADICVLRADDADLAGRVLHLMRQNDPAHLWLVERQTTLPASRNPDAKALAFCAIGDPNGFFQGLRRAGVNVQGEVAFRDHHVYSRTDVERIMTAARNAGVQILITTEKDSIRLIDGLRAELEEEFPLVIAGLRVSLCEEARSMSMLAALLAEGLQVRADNVR